MRCRAPRSQLRLVVAALLVVGCSKRSEEPDVSTLEIAEARTIRTGPVGIGDARAPATYALVDVSNRGSRAVVTDVVGELFDVAGNSLGPTRSEVLTIPAGATRMFALVDARRRVVDNASESTVRVRGASFAHTAERLAISGEKNYRDTGRAVVAGYVENRGEGDVTVMVIAGFYGSDGLPMAREAVPYQIDSGQRRATQHVGPEGSTRGVLFVADYN